MPAGKAPSNPPRPTAAFMPMRSAAAPPNTPPRPVPAASAPSARAPQYSSGTAKPDNKRKYAIFAGAGAAVVVVAVIIFLMVNSGNGGTGGDQTAQSPGAPTSAPGTAPKSTGAPSATDAPAGLGKTAPEGKISDYGAAGRALTAFYDSPSSGWSKLTQAAQQVYGGEQAFTDYWSSNKAPNYSTARADSGGANSDGSITMNLTVNGVRSGYRIVTVGGQMLIDADTRLPGSASR